MNKKLPMLISIACIICSCTGIPNARSDLTCSEKLNKYYTFCVQTVHANGANLDDSFPEYAGRMLVMRLRKTGLNVIYKQELFPTDFTYYLEMRVYEHEFMKNLSINYSSYMEVSIKDITGKELAIVSSKVDSPLSAAHADCLNALISACVNSIINMVINK
ncbi:MAG TPA: hypothetical protein P5522_05075 [Spirochaetia bacterium]|nr:hypothetical protein [Spirochaetia bacterium]